jgi:hypothetical protein
MPRTKGTPKTGGRKKGTPNKASMPIAEICEKLGCNPAEVLIEFCSHKNPIYRLQASKELANYLYPKRKAIEHSGEIGGPGQLSDDELDRRIQSLMKEK